MTTKHEEHPPPGARTAPANALAWTPLAALALATLLPSLALGIANVGLPSLAHAFGATFRQVQWVVVAYLMAVTTLIVGVGRLGDLVGRRRLLLAGIGLFTLASAACAAAPTLAWLVAARAVQGLGAAAMTALALALVAETVPKARAGRAMGLLGSASAAGTALGPALGGALVAGLGWRAIFWVLLPLGAAGWLLAWRHLPPERRTPARAQPTALTGVGLPRDPALGAGLLATALASTVVMATLVVGPFHLARALGLEAASVGLVLAAGPLVAAFVGVPAGRGVDRFGAHRMAALGLAAMAAGCAALALAPIALGVAGYVVPLALLTAGYALFQAANNTGVMAGAAPERRGVVSGLLNLARHLGLVTGAWAMGGVFAFAAGAADVAGAAPEAVAAGTRGVFAAAALLVALALLAAVGAQRRSAAARRWCPPESACGDR